MPTEDKRALQARALAYYQAHGPREGKNGVSILNVAKLFGVPKTTLCKTIDRGAIADRTGRPPALTQLDEELIVQELIDREEAFNSPQWETLPGVFTKVVGERNVWKHGYPSDSSVRRFLKRHARGSGKVTTIHARLEKIIDPARKAAITNTANYVRFYNNLKQAYAQFPALKTEPGRTVNLDESPLETRSKQLFRSRVYVARQRSSFTKYAHSRSL